MVAGGVTAGHRAVARAVGAALEARGAAVHLLLDRASARGDAGEAWPVTVLPDCALPGGVVPVALRFFLRTYAAAKPD